MAEVGDVEKIVFAYLQKKGYKNASAALMQEAALAVSSKVSASGSKGEEVTVEEVGAAIEDTVANYILFHESGEPVTALLFERGYKSLKRWIDNSLDLYQLELRTLLYPIFVHTFLEMIVHGFARESHIFLEMYRSEHEAYFGSDLAKLVCIMEPQQLAENELSQMFRQNKYCVRMCDYAFELFISFLQDSKLMHILKIVNQYINVQVYAGNPGTDTSTNVVLGITGHSARQLNAINDESVYWGSLPSDPKMLEDVDRALKEDLVRSNIPAEDIQKALDALKKSRNALVTDDSPSRDRVPLPTSKKVDVINEMKRIKDLRHRSPLGPASLPSICCYTFYNTYDTLTSMSLSKDSSLMSCGYSDSYLEVCTMNQKHRLRSLISSMEIGKHNLSDVSSLDSLKEKEGSHVKRLIGHSGPVYGSSFSYDNRFLLSCSQDATVRLWSLDTFMNVVCFKGHNYPVWDVDFGPKGHYFVTGSNDRTARLWSCSEIHPLRIFAGHLSDVDCVKFHPNSNYVATGSSDKTVRLWDIQTGKCVRLFTGHTGSVSSLSFSPDGKYLATGATDNVVSLWDLGTGKRVCNFTGHTGPIYALDFSRDISILASGGADNTVKVWDIQGALNGTIKAGDIAASSDSSSGIATSTAATNSESNLSSVKEKDKSYNSLSSFSTKDSKIALLQFTERNLLLAGSIFSTTKPLATAK